MSDKDDQRELEELYGGTEYWHVDFGEQTVHAKRMPGRFRTIKWAAMAAIYIPYFTFPYLRWEGNQAILFNIPARKFHFFGLHIWPQEVWIGALLLMFFFFAMYAATSIAGRVFCGYACWQTVWVDVYTWIEEKLEGQPAARKKLDSAPWSFHKIKIKAAKHAIFALLGIVTGISFVSYFIDVYQMWGYYFTLSGPKEIWITPIPFAVGSYLGVGFMREQTCFWLCPYARIQGVMSDMDTVLPTYNLKRGEPRGKVKHADDAAKQLGDCIDCHLCAAVCPTGIDIRHGQQEGCITCGLCIDACDSIMDKVGRPGDLISYMSLRELLGHDRRPFYKRKRVLIYSLILTLLGTGVLWGLLNIHPLSLTVLHERQPLFVSLSNGSIQNKYTLKVLNKTDADMNIAVELDGLEGASFELREEKIVVPAGKLKRFTALVRSHAEGLNAESMPIYFSATNEADPAMSARYATVFIGPKQ